MLTIEKLATLTQRTLNIEGPLTFPRLLSRLSFDSQFGFIALQDNNFEALLRNSLSYFSYGPKPLFSINHKYEWNTENVEMEELSNNESIEKFQAWLELGQGQEIVYAIFSPIQMERSWKDGILTYPIKIGRTSRPIPRRFLELQTGNYFDLKLGMKINTTSSTKLEAYIHKQLKHRQIAREGKRTEWFHTNLQFIKKLVQDYKDSEVQDSCFVTCV